MAGDHDAGETESLSQLIRRAINEGAPLYNKGMSKECYEVYADVIRAAMSESVLAGSSVGQILAQAAEEAAQVVSEGGQSGEKRRYAEAAWILRHCFDDILSRESNRFLTLTTQREPDSNHTLEDESQWQDAKVGNSTDFEKGQAMANIFYVLRASITPRQHTRVAQSYADCFQASEAVETLVGLGLGTNRKDVAEKCSLLLRAGLILPVSHPDDISFRDGTRLYRFPEHQEVQAALDKLLLDDQVEAEGTEKHVFVEALQTTLEVPDGYSEAAPTFSGVSTRSLRPRARPSILAAPEHYIIGVKLAEFAAIVETTVDISDRKYHLKSYERCFVGKEAVSKLVEDNIVRSHEEAIGQLGKLVHYGLARHVTDDHEFKDKHYFYRFSSAAEIKKALDAASNQVLNGQEDDDTAICCAALGCRYKRLTGLNIASLLNDFYGCGDESGWDVSDLENWRTNMKRWGFGRREDQDDAMVARLAPLVLNVDPEKWDKTDDEEWESPWGILAQIALFDQIPRSAFRGTPEAFKWDELAIRATKRALDKGYFDSAYRSTLNQFVLLLPLEHSESWDDQKLGVTLLLRMLSTVSVEDEGLSDYEVVKRLEFSKRLTTAFLEHAQVIAKFKRYPHRNRAQGRTTTLEERIWLASDLVPRWAKSQNPDEKSQNVVKAPVIPLKRLTRRK